VEENAMASTNQQKIDSIKDYVERLYIVDGEPGLMSEYPRCIDPNNDIWEIAFIIFLDDDLYFVLKTSLNENNSMLNFSTTYRGVVYNDCLFPTVLTRINKNEVLTFASMLNVAFFKGKKHPMEDVNLLKILNEQQKLYFDLVYKGKKLPGVYLTNQMRGTLGPDVARLDREKFDSDTIAKYSSSRRNFIFQAQLQAPRTSNIGQKLWIKLGC
jgi:hypothetical protein